LHTKLKKLHEIHEAFVAALDAGDVERLVKLTASRGEQLAALEADLAAATPAERERVMVELQDLLVLDRELQARCRSTRDELGRRLMSSGNGAPQRQEVASTGVLDRRA
jgi:hypothetical protein